MWWYFCSCGFYYVGETACLAGFVSADSVFDKMNVFSRHSDDRFPPIGYCPLMGDTTQKWLVKRKRYSVREEEYLG